MNQATPTFPSPHAPAAKVGPRGPHVVEELSSTLFGVTTWSRRRDPSRISTKQEHFSPPTGFRSNTATAAYHTPPRRPHAHAWASPLSSSQSVSASHSARRQRAGPWPSFAITSAIASSIASAHEPLYLAAHSNRTDIVRLLLDHAADCLLKGHWRHGLTLY